jgi:hypothetical protein
MPIINLQRKLTEVGRIRLGAKGAKGNPTKLDKFRLTSKSRDALDAAAAVYGGTVTAWSSPDGDAYELLTDTNTLDVVIPPGNALSQWYEMWSGAGCQRRCDGQTETISGKPCLCPADQTQRTELSARGGACRPTTRLSVILPNVKSVGIWRLESHGYHAAVELAGIAELLQQVSATDKYLPATLRLEQRSARRAGKLSRFAVPVLEVGATVQEAIAAAAGQPMLEAAKPFTTAKPQAPMLDPGFEEEAPTTYRTEPKPIAEVVRPAVIELDEEPVESVIVKQPVKVINDEPPLDDNPFGLEPIETEAPAEAPTPRKPLNYVQRIQILRRELGLSDEQYKAGLAKYNVSSSKELTPEQAAEVIARLSDAIAKKKAQ